MSNSFQVKYVNVNKTLKNNGKNKYESKKNIVKLKTFIKLSPINNPTKATGNPT